MNVMTKQLSALCLLSVLVFGWSPSYSDDSGNGAAEEETIATGGWSEAVDGLRGRLLVIAAPLPKAPLREPVVYLELENTRAKTLARNVHFDPRLSLALRNRNGEIVMPLGQGGSGRPVGSPEPCWVRFPFQSRMRLR